MFSQVMKLYMFEVFSSYVQMVLLLKVEVRKYRVLIRVVVYSVLCGMLLCEMWENRCGVLFSRVRLQSIWVEVYMLELLVERIVERIIVFIILVVVVKLVCLKSRVKGDMLMLLVLFFSRFGLVQGISMLIMKIVRMQNIRMCQNIW